MPPRHDIPIEQADLWDIIDWDVVVALSSEDTGDPRDGGGSNVLPAMATLLVKAGVNKDRSAERQFQKIASGWIRRSGEPAVRRQDAAVLAAVFGADPVRLIDYLAYKFQLFKRV